VTSPRLLVAVFLAFALATAHGEEPAPPEPAASEVPPAKPAPQELRRNLSPQEQRESTYFPGEMRKDEPVTPQISIPVGRKPPTTATPTSSSPNKINDAVARCKGQTTAQQREACAGLLATGQSY